MQNVTEILITNLTAAFSAIEKYGVVGLTSSMLALVVSIANPKLMGNLEFLSVEAPVQLVVTVTYVTCFVAGMMTLTTFRVRTKIVEQLRERNETVTKAALMYPSIAAKIDTPQLTVLFLPLIVMFVALSVFHADKTDVTIFWLATFAINSPYIMLLIYGVFVSVSERMLRLSKNDT